MCAAHAARYAVVELQEGERAAAMPAFGAKADMGRTFRNVRF